MDGKSFEKAKTIFKEMTRREFEKVIPSSLNLNYKDRISGTKISFPLFVSNPLLVSSDAFADIKIQSPLRLLFRIQQFQGLEIQVSTSSHSSNHINLNKSAIEISHCPSTLFISFQNLAKSTLSFSSDLVSFCFKFRSNPNIT